MKQNNYSNKEKKEIDSYINPTKRDESYCFLLLSISNLKNNVAELNTFVRFPEEEENELIDFGTKVLTRKETSTEYVKKLVQLVKKVTGKQFEYPKDAEIQIKARFDLSSANSSQPFKESIQLKEDRYTNLNELQRSLEKYEKEYASLKYSGDPNKEKLSTKIKLIKKEIALAKDGGYTIESIQLKEDRYRTVEELKKDLTQYEKQYKELGNRDSYEGRKLLVFIAQTKKELTKAEIKPLVMQEDKFPYKTSNKIGLKEGLSTEEIEFEKDLANTMYQDLSTEYYSPESKDNNSVDRIALKRMLHDGLIEWDNDVDEDENGHATSATDYYWLNDKGLEEIKSGEDIFENYMYSDHNNNDSQTPFMRGMETDGG